MSILMGAGAFFRRRMHAPSTATSSNLRAAQKLSLPPTEFISVEAVILHYGRRLALAWPPTELASVEAMIGDYYRCSQ